MRKIILILIVFMAVGVLFFGLSAYAQPGPHAMKDKARVNTNWERKADTNNDGSIDTAELDHWKNRPRGMSDDLQSREENEENNVGSVSDALRDKAVVDQEWEEKADANNDGIVDRVEIDQWKTMHHKGNSAVVDTKWEEKADVNKDGIVDKTEIEQWKAKQDSGK